MSTGTVWHRTFIALLFGAAITISMANTAEAGCSEQLAAIDEQLSEPGGDPSMLIIVQQFRSQAADLCSQGQEDKATQILGALESMVPAAKSGVMPASPPSPSGAPDQVPLQKTATAKHDPELKSRLTDDYLNGTWCSMTGDERTQLVFDTADHVKGCVSDAMLGPYGRCHDLGRAENWREKWTTISVVEDDRMVLAEKRRSPNQYRRGPCSEHGR